MRGAGNEATSYGRARGGLDQEIQNEPRRPFHQRPTFLLQEFTVATEFEVLPGMEGEPGRSHRPNTPNPIHGRCPPPKVRVVVDDPTSAFVIILCNFGPGDG